MPSILIHGGTPKTRQERALEVLQDHYLHSIEEEGKILPVGRIRKLLPHLHIQPPKPWQKRGVLIQEAQRMNEEVQNTLLKTLEEPPEFLTFVLTVPNPRLLLPTVVSRCLIEEVKVGEFEQGGVEILREILSAPFGSRLALFEEKIGYNRESAISFLESLEVNSSNQPATTLKGLWETKKLLRNDDTNIKFAVDRFLLSW